MLIIGGRYGYVDVDTAKSVTNLEYLAARAKGIPIYTFVDKEVLAVLSTWEANPEGNFSSVVDNPKVFEFIKQVRTTDKIWNNKFENAQDIIDALLYQFAHLQQEGLKWHLKLKRPDLAQFLNNLEGKALRIALEKPDGWEYLLFAQVLTDEVGKWSSLREDHQLKLVTGAGNLVKPEDIGFWYSNKLKRLALLTENLTTLLNEHLQVALGPPGTPGDAAAIIRVAKKIAVVYKDMLEWSLGCRGTLTHECYREVILFLSTIMDGTVENIEQYGPRLEQEFKAAYLKAQSGESVTYTGTLSLSPFDGNTLNRLFSEAVECYDRRPY